MITSRRDDTSLDTSLADFARRQRDHWTPRRGQLRATAAFATLALLALFVLAVSRFGLWTMPRPIMDTGPIVAILPIETAARPAPPPLPFLAPMIRPKAQDAALPQFSVQPAAPDTLSATKSSAPAPITGGGQTQASVSAPASGTGTAGAASGCLDAAWVRAVNVRLAGSFHYPQRAQLLGLTGRVRLHFTVKTDGWFSALDLTQGSGSYSLDTQAQAMLRAAQPLPAIPTRMHVDQVNGDLMILFGQQAAGLAAPLLTCH